MAALIFCHPLRVGRAAPPTADGPPALRSAARLGARFFLWL